MRNFKAKIIFSIIYLLSFSAVGQKSYISHDYKPYDPEISSVKFSKGMVINDQTGILYKISNSDNIISIDMVISDDMVQRKILSFGLTVWIDSNGKKKKELGVMFPIGREEFILARQANNPDRNNNRQVPGGSFEERKKDMAVMMKHVKLNGTADSAIRLNSLEEENIVARIKFNELGFMLYHIELPFSKLNLDLNTIKEHKINLGIEIGHLDMSQMQGQGGMRPGGGRQSGGGREGGNRSGNPEERRAIMEKMMQEVSFWVKNVKFLN